MLEKHGQSVQPWMLSSAQKMIDMKTRVVTRKLNTVIKNPPSMH